MTTMMAPTTVAPDTAEEDEDALADYEGFTEDGEQEEEEEESAPEAPAIAESLHTDADANAQVLDEETIRQLQIPKAFITSRDGKQFLLFPGLVFMLHERSKDKDGLSRFAVTTQIVQVPNGVANDPGNVAIVTAEVTIFDASGQVVRRTTGIGDASPGNVTRLIASHTLRMAETRAIARALRVIVNAGLAALEELGGDPEQRQEPRLTREEARRTARPRVEPKQATNAPRRPTVRGPDPEESIVIDTPNGKRKVTRREAWDTYTTARDGLHDLGLAVVAEDEARFDMSVKEIVDRATELYKSLRLEQRKRQGGARR